MNRHVVTLIKLLVVALLMWLVFRTIPFEDQLVRKADPTAKETIETVDIVGSWKQTPLRYRVVGDAVEREIRLGPQQDGSVIAIQPAFQTYWRNLDPWLFALGAACYFVTALIAGVRWWWLLRVTGTDVSLWEALRFTWIGIFFNTAMPGSTGGDVVKALYIMKRCPGHRGLFESRAAEKQDEQADRPLRLEGGVRKQPVIAERDRKRTRHRIEGKKADFRRAQSVAPEIERAKNQRRECDRREEYNARPAILHRR